MKTIRGKIRNIVRRLLPEVIETRHKLHSMPELAGREYKTSMFIRKKLTEMGIKPLPSFIGTDVVAILEGGGGENTPCITLRADIDALPLTEETGVSYSSMESGVMHACGHDGHTAILLGTAMVLAEMRDYIKGKVRFVFQPGEEVAALGKVLVDSGALDVPESDGVFAIHSNCALPSGVFGLRRGTMTAAADFFKITVMGKGGHASRPEDCIDPIVISAKIIDGIQLISSRCVNPQSPIVISITHISAGHNSNVIPEKAFMEGTVRYLDASLSEQIPVLMEKMISGMCSAMGAGYDFKYSKDYIPTDNSDKFIPLVVEVIKKYIGETKIKILPKASMGGEDFSFYLKKYPGVFVFMGMNENYTSLHSPKFDFNDETLEPGITYFSALAIEFMEKFKRISQS